MTINQKSTGLRRSGMVCAVGLAVFAASGTAMAQSPDGMAMDPAAKQAMMMKMMAKKLPHPMPAGVFGTFMLPKKGKGVFGYGYTNIQVEGLIEGDDEVSPEYVAANTPNPFFGLPGQPPTQRIIPTQLDVHVHKFYGLYSVTDHVSVAALVPYIRKDMKAVTFDPTGTTRIGTSVNDSNGLGDIKVGLVTRIYDDQMHHLLLDTVLSAPTGSITKKGAALAPNGVMTPTRLFYGMQLGSGTWDAMLGLSYWGKKGPWGWGAQYMATVRLEDENDEHWRYGNKQEVNTWLSYRWKPQLTTSIRLAGSKEGRIDGGDPNMVGPALGADPDNYGGEKLELSLGVNFMPARGHNLSLEYGEPIYQDRNGVQGDHQRTINANWRMVF